MSSFKIYIKKGSKCVVCNGKFSDYPQYSALVHKIIENSQKANFNKENLDIKKDEPFVLAFCDEEKDSNFIPEEVSEGIYDSHSYKFFIKKLITHNIKDSKYKLYIERVSSLPVWKKKEFDEILRENMEKCWENTLNYITNDLNLMKLEECKNNFDNMLQKYKENENNISKIQHNDIICSNCLKKNFSGRRFICSECHNYNLCQNCESIKNINNIHNKEHIFIQINKEIKDDYFQYNNIIGNNCKELKSVDKNFELEIKIANNGDNDLKNCFIMPIRYGNKYLSCDIKTINDSIEKGKNAKVNLAIKLPDKFGYYEGYFRMFTPSGLPFGDIIKIKVFNRN